MTKAIEAVKDSIAHWKRMIAWVKTCPLESRTCSDTMRDAIGENCRGEYCPLCQKFYTEGNYNLCRECPLNRIGEDCNKPGSTWKEVIFTVTWGDWLIAAGKMVEALKTALRNEGLSDR